jgi:chromosome segregation ATPase
MTDQEFREAVDKYSVLAEKYNKAADKIVQLQAELEQERKARVVVSSQFDEKLDTIMRMHNEIQTLKSQVAEYERAHERVHSSLKWIKQSINMMMPYVPNSVVIERDVTRWHSIMVIEEALASRGSKVEALVSALAQIMEREKPGYDNDPLGLGIVNDSYKIARAALKAFRGE